MELIFIENLRAIVIKKLDLSLFSIYFGKIVFVKQLVTAYLSELTGSQKLGMS